MSVQFSKNSTGTSVKIIDQFYFYQILVKSLNVENFLNLAEILYRFQFGFRKGFSTNHAFLSIVEQVP